MAWADPQATQDPTTGVKATAALLNVWRADMDYLWGPRNGAEADRTTDLAISGTTAITLPSAENFDNGTFHDLATNSDRFTVPAGMGGIYLIGVQTLQTNGSAALVRIRLNNTSTLDFRQMNSNSVGANGHGWSCTTLARLAVGDFVTADINFGTTLDCDTSVRVGMYLLWMGG